MDVLFFGTSFCYCSFDPTIFKNYGIESYNLGKAQLTLSWTYYQMHDALKYQHPDIIILEPYATTYKMVKSDDISEGVANACFDNMNLSLDSIKGAIENVPAKRLPEFIFPIIRWHNNPEIFKKLGKKKDTNKDLNRGYIRFTEHRDIAKIPTKELLEDTSEEELYVHSEKEMNDIYNLCKEKDITLIIVRAPFPLETQPQMNALKKWANKKGIPFLDLIYIHDEIGIDYTLDTLDGMHLNQNGSEKVSRYVAEWLMNNDYLSSK